MYLRFILVLSCFIAISLNVSATRSEADSINTELQEGLKRQGLIVDSLVSLLETSKEDAAIYGGEVSKLKELSQAYKTTVQDEANFNAGNDLINKMEVFNTNFAVVEKLKNELNDYYSQVTEGYKTRFPGVFDNDLKLAETDISNWKAINNTAERIKKAENIKSKLKSMESSLPKLVTADSLLDKKFQEIDKKYKEGYPNIYKAEIKPFSAEIAACKALTKIDSRLKVADELISRMNLVDKSFTEFKNTDASLEKNFPILEANYKTTFPPIYTNEIYPINGKILEYNNKSNISEKRKAGKQIMELIQNLSEIFTEFKAIDNNIAKNFPVVEKKYKDTYSAIYKMEVKPINLEINVYKSLNVVAEKLKVGQELDAKIKMLETKYTELVEQEKEIQSKYQSFLKVYENNKPNKVVYKKGEALYDYYFDLYKQTVYINPKKENGDDIVIALNKLISLASKNNSYLIDELKKTKSQEDVKKVLGF